MHPKLPSQEELLKLLNEQQFLELILTQLNKDIGGIENKIVIDPNNDAAGQIKESLADYIKELDSHSPSRLQELMYRVDVEQKKVAEAYSHSNETDLYQSLASVILDREMKKVWFRLNYS